MCPITPRETRWKAGRLAAAVVCGAVARRGGWWLAPPDSAGELRPARRKANQLGRLTSAPRPMAQSTSRRTRPHTAWRRGTGAGTGLLRVAGAAAGSGGRVPERGTTGISSVTATVASESRSGVWRPGATARELAADLPPPSKVVSLATSLPRIPTLAPCASPGEDLPCSAPGKAYRTGAARDPRRPDHPAPGVDLHGDAETADKIYPPDEATQPSCQLWGIGVEDGDALDPLGSAGGDGLGDPVQGLLGVAGRAEGLDGAVAHAEHASLSELPRRAEQL